MWILIISRRFDQIYFDKLSLKISCAVNEVAITELHNRIMQ